MSGRPSPARPPWLGRRGAVVVLLAALGLLAAVRLGLAPSGLVPGEGGARLAGEFVRAAFRPAATYEAAFVPTGAPPFLSVVALALWRTVVFAVAATSLALPTGLLLGFLASSSSWGGSSEPGTPVLRRLLRGSWATVLQGAARAFVAAARSVHELLWAVVLLAAFGLTPGTAVLALAIPYSGILGKVFAELIDEAPDDAEVALRAGGASSVRAFLFGRLVRAAPDLAAYAFYRLECAVRSSAVLGFFGFETVGYFLASSFDNLHYREVWTFLYALIALVLLLERWSAALRTRFVA